MVCPVCRMLYDFNKHLKAEGVTEIEGKLECPTCYQAIEVRKATVTYFQEWVLKKGGL